MKYIRKFNNLSEYQEFIGGKDYVEPHLVLIENDDIVKYKKFVPPPPPIIAGDVAYWDGNKVQLVSKITWNSSLGTPIGVVVIPPNMLPDGKARILSLKPVDSNGNAVNSNSGMIWGGNNIDISTLTNYNRVPITDNNNYTTTGSYPAGCLPSDEFTGTRSFVDPKAYYGSLDKMIPSPYLDNDNTLNPAYCEVISGYNNALSDFNGLSNTQTLVNLGNEYIAANAAWNYKDDINSGLQWYLPAIGELGFMRVRKKEINNTITMLGKGISIGNQYHLSSSESSSQNIFGLHMNSDIRIMNLNTTGKKYEFNVRPFTII